VSQLEEQASARAHLRGLIWPQAIVPPYSCLSELTYSEVDALKPRRIYVKVLAPQMTPNIANQIAGVIDYTNIQLKVISHASQVNIRRTG
jgi:hypothetical protein